MENTAQMAKACPAESPAKPARRRRHRSTRPQLLTRAQLDGRTNIMERAASIMEGLGDLSVGVHFVFTSFSTACLSERPRRANAVINACCLKQAGRRMRSEF